MAARIAARLIVHNDFWRCIVCALQSRQQCNLVNTPRIHPCRLSGLRPASDPRRIHKYIECNPRNRPDNRAWQTIPPHPAASSHRGPRVRISNRPKHGLD